MARSLASNFSTSISVWKYWAFYWRIQGERDRIKDFRFFTRTYL